jgi:hypothetical protein
LPALSFSILATTASAGGQLLQPSEVNSSTTAKPLPSASGFACCIQHGLVFINAAVAKPAASRMMATVDNIFMVFISWCIFTCLVALTDISLQINLHL